MVTEQSRQWTCDMQALTVVLLPTSFFFIFLYYTDVGSLAFFLASYLVTALCPHGSRLAVSSICPNTDRSPKIWQLKILGHFACGYGRCQHPLTDRATRWAVP